MKLFKKSLTLFELLICLGLIGVVFLSIGSVELFSRYQVINSERRAKLQAEATSALAHMKKNIGRAIGDVSNSPFDGYTDNRGLRIRIDSNGNGRLDAADIWIAYRHEADQIVFFPNSPDNTPPLPAVARQLIATNIVVTLNPLIAESAANPYGLKLDNPNLSTIIVTIRARWDTNPANPVTRDNPELIYKARILCPSVSAN